MKNFFGFRKNKLTKLGVLFLFLAVTLYNMGVWPAFAIDPLTPGDSSQGPTKQLDPNAGYSPETPSNPSGNDMGDDSPITPSNGTETGREFSGAGDLRPRTAPTRAYIISQTRDKTQKIAFEVYERVFPQQKVSIKIVAITRAPNGTETRQELITDSSVNTHDIKIEGDKFSFKTDALGGLTFEGNLNQIVDDPKLEFGAKITMKYKANDDHYGPIYVETQFAYRMDHKEREEAYLLSRKVLFVKADGTIQMPNAGGNLSLTTMTWEHSKTAQPKLTKVVNQMYGGYLKTEQTEFNNRQLMGRYKYQSLDNDPFSNRLIDDSGANPTIKITLDGTEYVIQNGAEVRTGAAKENTIANNQMGGWTINFSNIGLIKTGVFGSASRGLGTNGKPVYRVEFKIKTNGADNGRSVKYMEVLARYIKNIIDNPQQNPQQNPVMNPQQNPVMNPQQNPVVNPQQNPNQNPAVNPRQNPQQNPQQNAQQNPQQNPQQNAQQNPQQNPVMNPQQNPVMNPNQNPVVNPKQNPGVSPQQNPVMNPQQNPVMNPQQNPVVNPQQNPKENPAVNPRQNPNQNPQQNPNQNPQQNPKENPGVSPQQNPVMNPQQNPVMNPQQNPVVNPKQNPGVSPQQNPVMNPQQNPVVNPQQNPKENPAVNPRQNPNQNPQQNPKENPGVSPQQNPVMNPQQNPVMNPQQNPVVNPKQNPGVSPQQNPNQNPVVNPRQNPVMNPQQNPVVNPQQNPKLNPWLNPGLNPQQDQGCDYLVFNEITGRWEWGCQTNGK